MDANKRRKDDFRELALRDDCVYLHARIIPMILLVMSSVTDNNTLISNGYSFFRRNSACMRINIFLRPEMQFCRHMEFLLY